jgi:glycosyltransferase involved in cell wall biosynthesis
MISVCIPTFNGEKYIRQQLDSILCLLGPEDEVIISDDSSRDSTLSIIKSYTDSRIKLYYWNDFKSPIFNLEYALKKAKGDWIFLADQDDVWLAGRVALAIEKLASYDIVVCNSHIVDQSLNIIHPSYFEWKGCGGGFLRNLRKNSYLGCSLAFNRSILEFALPFPKKIAMHDIWIGMVGELIGRSCFISEPLFLYRRHEGNFTYDITKTDETLSDFSVWYKVWYRVLIVWYLGVRYFQRRIWNK